ncbi:hypothetical protein SELMODRAFT_404446 [Selaginella moellendorffii]|uniref:Uncharacterized protein n=1 Tax=Selaginella moellendorffii TaxID=88036 RepID=D8QVC7_SELML|nr:hypothetical protein SELMODRAFT_404446 [Selaginella moellendorffii]
MELVEFFVSFDVPSSGFVLSEMSTGIVDEVQQLQGKPVERLDDLETQEGRAPDRGEADTRYTYRKHVEYCHNNAAMQAMQATRDVSHASGLNSQWQHRSLVPRHTLPEIILGLGGNEQRTIHRDPFLRGTRCSPRRRSRKSRTMASTTTTSKHLASSNFRGLPVRSRSRRSFAATRIARKISVTCRSNAQENQVRDQSGREPPHRRQGLLQIAAEFHGEMHQRQESLSEPTHEAEKFIKEDVELLRMSLSKPSSSEPLHEAKKSIKEDRELLRRSGPVLEL